MDEVKKSVIIHINRMRDLIRDFTDELKKRAFEHDFSKMRNPEYELLKNIPEEQFIHEYGSQGYAEMLKRIDPPLKIHHQNNTHHPEHYPNGIDDMDLYDICEMFFDWKASSEKHSSGDIWKSLEVGKERFNMSDQLYNILKNTADRIWKENQSQES